MKSLYFDDKKWLKEGKMLFYFGTFIKEAFDVHKGLLPLTVYAFIDYNIASNFNERKLVVSNHICSSLGSNVNLKRRFIFSSTWKL